MTRAFWRSLLAGLLSLGCPAVGAAQVVRLTPRPAASGGGQLLNSITVSSTPSGVSFALLSGGVAAGSAPLSITTSWLLGVAAKVQLYASFQTAAALTSTGGDGTTIPASSVLGQCSTGALASYTPFLQSGPFGSYSLLLFQQNSLVSVAANRTDQLTLSIDLSSLPQLPAGAYSGTLLLQAQAF